MDEKKSLLLTLHTTISLLIMATAIFSQKLHIETSLLFLILISSMCFEDRSMQDILSTNTIALAIYSIFSKFVHSITPNDYILTTIITLASMILIIPSILPNTDESKAYNSIQSALLFLLLEVLFCMRPSNPQHNDHASNNDVYVDKLVKRTY